MECVFVVPIKKTKTSNADIISHYCDLRHNIHENCTNTNKKEKKNKAKLISFPSNLRLESL